MSAFQYPLGRLPGFSACMIILLILHTGSVQAQKASGKTYSQSLGLSAGAGFLTRQDLIFSPFIHRDLSPVALSIDYRRKRRWQQFASISASMFSPSHGPSFSYSRDPGGPVFQTYAHNFVMLDIDYGLGKTWINMPAGSLTLGFVSFNRIQALSYSMGAFGMFGYFASFGLGGWMEYHKPIGFRHAITLGAKAPLLAWTARSPYLVNDDVFIQNIYSHKGLPTFLAFVGDGRLQTINRLRTFSFSGNYTYHLHPRWDTGLVWRFEFLRHTRPLLLQSFQHNVQLSLARLF